MEFKSPNLELRNVHGSTMMKVTDKIRNNTDVDHQKAVSSTMRG
jgi:hypothetical protein